MKKHLSKNCLRHPQASNAHLKLTLNLQSFRGVRLRPHMAYMQIFSKKLMRKKHVDENLEKKTPEEHKHHHHHQQQRK